MMMTCELMSVAVSVFAFVCLYDRASERPSIGGSDRQVSKAAAQTN